MEKNIAADILELWDKYDGSMEKYDIVSCVKGCYLIHEFFVTLGVPAMHPVANTIKTSCDSLEKIYEGDETKMIGVQSILEEVAKDRKGKRVMTQYQKAALALVHVMEFILTFLKNSVLEEGKFDSPKAAGRAAYADTLSKHHNWAVKKIYNAGMAACPNLNSICCGLFRHKKGTMDVTEAHKAYVKEHIAICIGKGEPLLATLASGLDFEVKEE
ncbi:hypothetical protein ADUPG1_013877 [Aduncisulcus paluster]|uniref:Glycolipid transfer protein domain-containing protein n=1 Tax=Aduncisulcus paluster TaxID=2918883 RepID=A0ABQ5K7T6_9EUKA|nr:hypothetical protein ADUPG1_013877 [Aduncisulcus paluster]